MNGKAIGGRSVSACVDPVEFVIGSNHFGLTLKPIFIAHFIKL